MHQDEGVRAHIEGVVLVFHEQSRVSANGSELAITLPMNNQKYESRSSVDEGIVRRAKKLVAGFPENFEERLHKKPYVTVGIAFAGGVALGVVFGSRVMRKALTSAAAMAIFELGRSYVLREVEISSASRRSTTNNSHVS